jgi:uncharacterized membrane protein
VELLALVALGVALVAWRRTRRLAELEGRVRSLELVIAEGGARHDAAAAEPPIAAPAPPREAPPSPLATPPPPAPTPTVAPQPRPELPQPPAPPRAPRAPKAPRVPIDWERWLGVRGAALLGGIVLALAGLLFVRYSIEHGLIPPWLRVVLGIATGIGCLVASDRALRPRYEATANALAGAGVVILYGAFWAARASYELIGTGPTFAAMLLVTVTGCALSWRHRSLVIGVLGLAGGFATPLLVSTGEDRPIGLFGYLLLLDFGLLFLSRRRGWPLLALGSVLGTALYQVLWIGFRMTPERHLLGLAILGVFALLFSFAGRGQREEAASWRVSRAASLLFPVAFGLYFAARADLGLHVAPLALLLALVGAASGTLSRIHSERWLGLATAAATVPVFATWLLRAPLGNDLAWEAAAMAVLLAAVHHFFVERERDVAGWDGPAPAALAIGGGLLALFAAAPLRHSYVALWPWLAAWLGLALLLIRHAGFPRRAPLQLAAAVGMACGFSLWLAIAPRQIDLAWPWSYAVASLGVAVVFQAVAILRRRGPAHRFAEHAAALLCAALLLSFASPVLPSALPAFALLGTALLLGVLGAFVAARLGAGGWLLVALGTFALVLYDFASGGAASGVELTGLGIGGLGVVFFWAWPVLCGGALERDRFASYASALAPAAGFPALRLLFEARFGDAFIGALPLGLAVLSIAAARHWQRARSDDPARARGLIWQLAVGLGFLTVAIPLQLDREWITIGWALEGAALIWLWRRFDHPGLKLVGVALLLGVTIRLVANPALLGYHPRASWPVLNWLLYTYLVPAAALLVSAGTLAKLELPRLRPFETQLYVQGRPLGALALGLSGLLVVFAWINLTVIDAFSTGAALELRFERGAARDLALSLAWVVYALTLLTLGVRRASRALRWASLGLMMVTIAKVFLYDLGELRDLYRVASLLGLALSLIAVSLAYQRFVFRREPNEEAA